MRPKTKSCFSQLHLNVLAAILAMLLLSACGGSGSQSDSLRIGVVLYAQDDTFISSMSQNLEQLVQEEESRIGQKITLFISDSRHNQTTQMDQVDRFLARGCDILCVNIVDRTAAAVAEPLRNKSAGSGPAIRPIPGKFPIQPGLLPAHPRSDPPAVSHPLSDSHTPFFLWYF